MDIKNRLDALHQKKFNQELAKQRAERSLARLNGQIRELELVLENPDLAAKSHLVSRNLRKKPKKKMETEKTFSEETHEIPLESHEVKPRNSLKKRAFETLFGDDEGGSDE